MGNNKIIEKAELKSIELNKLELWSEANARTKDPYIDIRELADSIRANGVLVPLIVKEEIVDEKYLVISGQRRLLACKMLNYSPVPCLILKDVSLEDAKILSMSENIYRLPMNADDLSDACDHIYKKFKDFAEVAKRLGVSESTVRKYLGYKNVPNELRKFVKPRGLTASQIILIYTKYPELKRAIKVAKELAKIKNRQAKAKFFQAIKELPPTSIRKIRKHAKRIAKMRKYVILLPPKTSDVIEKVAHENEVEPEYIIVQILEYWVEERARLPLAGKIYA
jgi:ParB/RepB/Spo0J family partition protein